MSAVGRILLSPTRESVSFLGLLSNYHQSTKLKLPNIALLTKAFSTYVTRLLKHITLE